MSATFLLEPDIIAANENIQPEVATDLLLAKNFLKAQSAATGDTLYDHLVDIIHKIITHKPPDAVDNFEQLSWEIKRDKFRPNFDILNDLYLSPTQLAQVRKMDDMFKLIMSKIKSQDDMGEEEQLDLEEETSMARVADIIDNNYYFKEGGYGLPDNECYAVFIALKMLACSEPLSYVRFWGKIYGTKANYYIAETDLTMEELDRRIREFDMLDMPDEGEGDEAKEPESVEEHKEDLGEGEGKEKPTGPVPPTLPPMPENRWVPPPKIPVERPGQGVNRKVYYVCNCPGDAWQMLPDVTPAQIVVARQVVRAMTGNLDAEVQVFPPFEGTERNFLRAQIARIAAATAISPQGFYTFGSGEEEEDVDMEEGGDMAFNPNPFYRGHSVRDLASRDLVYWVHHGRHILPQGRTIWWNPTAGIGELEEEDEDAPPPAIPETGPHLMSPLADDALMEGIPAWTPRVSSCMAPERALVTLRSTVWPGAVAFANTGKKSDSMYIGWGFKFQPPNYSPIQLPRPQEEYLIGPEVMETADPTFADEEAYRIAHLPPPPPTIQGEGGEWAGEEEEDEQEEEEEEE